MKCLICEKDDWRVIHSYDKPDKYEKWMGIDNVQRSWEQCPCGFYQSRRNYPIEDLQKIYTNGYRDKGFRCKSIYEAYQHIRNLPSGESENEVRVDDFMYHFKDVSVLDVGSGLGVFPKRLKEEGFEVRCVEPNKESQWLINEFLDIKCESNLPEGVKFDGVTLIHVLEHIVDPVPFLEKIRKVVNKILYIEVPDAAEFGVLKKEHNEFSSDHVYFYNTASLYEIIKRAGFKVDDWFYSDYKERGLTRLTMICKKN